MPRLIAIGDVHGCSYALASLLAQISPQPEDTIVTLGDYVDRGIDSQGVIKILIELSNRCRLVSLLGNHDQLMLAARKRLSAFNQWMQFGGIATLDSYGETGQLDQVPESHFEFLRSCLPYFEMDTHFFVHANYDPDLPLSQQDDHTLRWLSLMDRLPSPHSSGKVAIVGHTPQAEILNLGHLVCIDTGCGFCGTLTALEVKAGEIWQVPE